MIPWNTLAHIGLRPTRSTSSRIIHHRCSLLPTQVYRQNHSLLCTRYCQGHRSTIVSLEFPWPPILRLTPLCLPVYSSPSGSEDYQNVFDITFGQSLTHRDQVGPPARTALSYDPSPPPMTHAFEVSMFHSPSPRDTASRHSSPTTSETSQSNDRRRFPCLTPGCSRRFTSQYTLRVHMEAHKPKSRVTFPCTLGCKERFSRQHDRLRHEVAKHGKICEHLCDECGRFFSTKKTLGNHKCPLAQGGTRWVHNN